MNTVRELCNHHIDNFVKERKILQAKQIRSNWGSFVNGVIDNVAELRNRIDAGEIKDFNILSRYIRTAAKNLKQNIPGDRLLSYEGGGSEYLETIGDQIKHFKIRRIR